MKRSFLSMMLATLALPVVTACPGDDGSQGEGNSRPFRDEWRTVINQPFETIAEDNSINIQSITIGDSGGANFNNRGDVIVQYHDEPRIIVEMRKFTMVESQGLADEDFDKLSIWGSTATLPPPPFPLEDDDNCVDPENSLPWQDGCQIAVFYDGQQQPDRSGADLRVTLPRDFIYDLSILTADNLEDSDYQNRGNVCIDGLPGSADVELQNGTAWVIMAENASEMPTCPADDRAMCEAANWDPTCPCLAPPSMIPFGQVTIDSAGGQAANGVLDIPGGGDFWATYNMRNDGQNAPGNDEPGALCEAVVEESVGTVRVDESIDLTQSPNTNQGSINFPGSPATEGAGFNVQMNSDQCSVVLATEDPDNFVGAGEGATQDSEERGNLTICSGCARSIGCGELVPGL